MFADNKFISDCGPHGCGCTLKETDESFLKVFGDGDQPEELKRSKRGGCCKLINFYLKFYSSLLFFRIQFVVQTDVVVH